MGNLPTRRMDVALCMYVTVKGGGGEIVCVCSYRLGHGCWNEYQNVTSDRLDILFRDYENLTGLYRIRDQDQRGKRLSDNDVR